MVYRGTVRNGVVEIEDGAGLPEGTRVNVQPVTEGDNGDDVSDPLFDIGRRAVPIGQSDLATNLDHYLYGHPRVGDEQR